MRADDITSRPARHLVHHQGDGADAARHVGNNQTITIDVDGQCLRLHDEITQGGYACVPFFTPGGPVPMPLSPGFGINLTVVGTLLEVKRVAVNVPFTNVSTFTVVHNQANFPLVQIIDTTTMEVIDAEIVHTNNNQFIVNFTTPTTGIIVF